MQTYFFTAGIESNELSELEGRIRSRLPGLRKIARIERPHGLGELEKIARGIGPNLMTEQNCDIAIFFYFLPSCPGVPGSPGPVNCELSISPSRLALRIANISSPKRPVAERLVTTLYFNGLQLIPARAREKGTKSGKAIGRPRIPALVRAKIHATYQAGGVSLRQLAKQFGIGRETVRRLSCGGD
jgi:hypothetical protein